MIVRCWVFTFLCHPVATSYSDQPGGVLTSDDVDDFVTTSVTEVERTSRRYHLHDCEIQGAQLAHVSDRSLAVSEACTGAEADTERLLVSSCRSQSIDTRASAARSQRVTCVHCSEVDVSHCHKLSDASVTASRPVTSVFATDANEHLMSAANNDGQSSTASETHLHHAASTAVDVIHNLPPDGLAL